MLNIQRKRILLYGSEPMVVHHSLAGVNVGSKSQETPAIAAICCSEIAWICLDFCLPRTSSSQSGFGWVSWCLHSTVTQPVAALTQSAGSQSAV